jgi:hypothetical protein
MTTKFEYKVFLIMGIIICILIVGQIAHGTHLYHGVKWPAPTIYYCLSSNLGNLNIGYTNAKADIRQAAADINNIPYLPWVLYQVADGDPTCKLRVQSGSLDPYYLAITYNALDTSHSCARTLANPCWIKSSNIYINQNIKTWTMTGCKNGDGTGPYRLVYTMHHENGHEAALVHSTTFSDPTIMYPVYHCDRWVSYSSHDMSTFRSIYPQ